MIEDIKKDWDEEMLHDAYLSPYAYYVEKELLYDFTIEDIVDTNGVKIGENIKSLALPDTWLVSLNMEACRVSNHALFETFGDPGGMLVWLE